MSFALILGFLMIVSSFIPNINMIIGHILESILNFESVILDILQELSIDNIKIFSPEIITILIFYLILFIMFGFIKLNDIDKWTLKGISCSLIFALIFNLYLIFDYDKVEVHFIDVGQGDAILIRSKRADYLMDTGGSLFGDYNIAEGITLPYLEKLGIKRLNGLFITHFDEDHSQGLSLLVDELEVKNIFASYIPKDSEILSAVESNDIKVILLMNNHKLKLSKDVFLDIIWPNSDTYITGNNASLVSILRTNGANILLTGDIEKEVEYLIKDTIAYPIDILKVPHHGSNTSSTELFLESIRPKDAIISVGRNNMYNHPSEDVLDRYIRYGSNIYRTDEMGLVKVVIDSHGYKILPFLLERR